MRTERRLGAAGILAVLCAGALAMHARAQEVEAPVPEATVAPAAAHQAGAVPTTPGALPPAAQDPHADATTAPEPAASSAEPAASSAEPAASPAAPDGAAAGAAPQRGPLQADDPWFLAAQQSLAEAKARKPNLGLARNVILVVGDGMSIATQTAARILAGQLHGESGEEGWLSFERFPHSALVKTYSVDHQVAESAATATALLAGVKTRSAVVGVGAGTTRGDCASGRENLATSLLELAERAGMSTGVVTTARITDATPAAAYAHGADRIWEADVDLPPEAIAAGCTDFARQLVEQSNGDGVDVALGGGRAQFLPVQRKDPADPRSRGARGDRRDLTAEWIANRPKSAFVWNRDQLLAQDAAGTDHLLGLFAHSHMQFEADRERTPNGEPSLLEMTARALDILERNPHGYFLLVEGGRIDHAHHGGNAYRALSDTIELGDTVAMLAERTNPESTLILVTADHGHTLTISGYSRRGNPILGKVVENGGAAKLARDGMPYATLSYANGPGASVNAGRSDLSQVKTASTAFRQQATVPLELETHSGEDVAVFARGPLSHLIGGTVEQSYLFQVMYDAARLSESRVAPPR